MQRRVQFAVLLQFAEHGRADRTVTAGICPGTDRRDLETALRYLIDSGSIVGAPRHVGSLVELAETGGLSLTPAGQLRFEENAI